MRRQQKNTIKLIAVAVSVLVVFSLLTLSGFIAYEQSLKETLRELHQKNGQSRAKLMHITLHAKQLFKQISTLADCGAASKRRLQTITINDPTISITFVKDQAYQCTNIRNVELPKNLSQKKDINIQGPFIITGIKEPAFIISQLVNDKLVGLIIPKSVIALTTESRLSPYLLTSLYKTPHYQPLLLNNHLKSTRLEKLEQSQLIKTILSADNHIKAVTKVALYNDLYLLNAISNRWVIKKIEHHLILLATLAILLSTLAITLIIRLTKSRLSLEYDLSVALKHDEFFPHYQAVINLQTGQLSGVECLMRWQRDGETIIYPNDFIETLIDSPLIQPVTERLIQKIFMDLGEYCASHPNFHLAINLTPTHFEDETILNLVLCLCDRYGVNSSQIIFELTEQNLIDENDNKAKSVMQAMRQAGIKIALDDFGTGFANINYLQRFHFDYLKIDRQFVLAIHSGAVTENIAASIVHLAHNLELQVIAEGIDNLDHANYLKELGVAYAQGYYYAKPVSIKALKKELPSHDENAITNPTS